MAQVLASQGAEFLEAFGEWFGVIWREVALFYHQEPEVFWIIVGLVVVGLFAGGARWRRKRD